MLIVILDPNGNSIVLVPLPHVAVVFAIYISQWPSRNEDEMRTLKDVALGSERYLKFLLIEHLNFFEYLVLE